MEILKCRKCGKEFEQDSSERQWDGACRYCGSSDLVSLGDVYQREKQFESHYGIDIS